MLYAAHVARQLIASLDHFRAFAESEQAAYRAFDQAVAVLSSLTPDELAVRLEGVARAGALPSEEWAGSTELVVPFATALHDHRAARIWALDRISGIRTLAVDGSEIKPTKDYSLPLAAVQVAWFENPHLPSGHYVKDVSFQIVHPDELIEEHADGFGIVDQLLALRRFQAEVNKLIERMNAIAEAGFNGPPPVAFFDGSLVVSFAGAMLQDLGTGYISAICRLLAASEDTRVPVVGYIDTSMAKDLGTMLGVLGDLPAGHRVPDSRIVNSRVVWGDRTRALVCARDDVLGRYTTDDGQTFAREICFTYLKTNQFAAPARIDFPRWILRDGLLDHVVDVVRAEVIIGNGYPYCIETADQCAVLGSLDREHFYRVVQDFASSEGLNLRIVPKAASKRRRRS
jgi:hypothetical protein